MTRQNSVRTNTKDEPLQEKKEEKGSAVHAQEANNRNNGQTAFLHRRRVALLTRGDD